MGYNLTEEELRKAYKRCRLPWWGSYEQIMAHPLHRLAVIAVAKNARKQALKLSAKDYPPHPMGSPPEAKKTPQIERHYVDVKRLAAGDKDDP